MAASGPQPLAPVSFHKAAVAGRLEEASRWGCWRQLARLGRVGAPVPKVASLIDVDSLCDNERESLKVATEQIEKDVDRTFEFFGESKQRSLFNVLYAYARHNPNVGYCQGMNFVAGFLLEASPNEEEAFEVFVCMMDHLGLAGLYSEGFPLLMKYKRDCDQFLKEELPALHQHFAEEDILPDMYVSQWLHGFFVKSFPCAWTKLAWDVILGRLFREGTVVIFNIIKSILEALQETLLALDACEISDLFQRLRLCSRAHVPDMGPPNQKSTQLEVQKLGRLLLGFLQEDANIEGSGQEPRHNDSSSTDSVHLDSPLSSSPTLTSPCQAPPLEPTLMTRSGGHEARLSPPIAHRPHRQASALLALCYLGNIPNEERRRTERMSKQRHASGGNIARMYMR